MEDADPSGCTLRSREPVPGDPPRRAGRERLCLASRHGRSGSRSVSHDRYARSSPRKGPGTPAQRSDSPSSPDPPVPKGTPLHRRLSHPRDQELSESGVCSVLHAPESSEEMEAHSAAAGDFGAVYRARMSSGPGRSRQRPFPCSEYGISQAPASHSTRPKRCRLLAMSA